jgi:hypothetical protein
MIAPAEIREKAARLYSQAVVSWLKNEGESRYPWRIPCDLRLSNTPSVNVANVTALKAASKDNLGYGYSLVYEQSKSRKHGNNQFIVAIYIDSRLDLLKLIGKLAEFKTLEARVRLLRGKLPELETWIQTAWSKLIDLDAIEDLIEVALYLKQNPRPGCFTRELPLAVPTKLIQNHEAILREWLNRILPPDSIDCDCDPKNFKQRYGFRFFRKHILTCVLDPVLQRELSLVSSEFSLPPHEIARLPIVSATVVIVENQVTLLTLPPIKRGIAFFGMGMGVTQLFDMPWLRDLQIIYWGDLDVEGFQILALLRRHYPKTTSILMDLDTIVQSEHLATNGTDRPIELPSELNPREAEAFQYLKERNLRIEQEHILQRYVNASLR